MRLTWSNGALSLFFKGRLLTISFSRTPRVEMLGLIDRLRVGPFTVSFYRTALLSSKRTEIIILALSGSWHDSTAALLRDGHIVAALEEERMTRHKHDASQFPINATLRLLAWTGISWENVDHFAIGW